MPHGPHCTLPVGTHRQRHIENAIYDIDRKISSTEGDTVEISAFDLWRCADYGIREDLVRIYSEAGWKYVYWRCDLNDDFDYFDKLILSNDYEHLPVYVIEKRKGFWWLVRKILGGEAQ